GRPARRSLRRSLNARAHFQSPDTGSNTRSCTSPSGCTSAAITVVSPSVRYTPPAPLPHAVGWAGSTGMPRSEKAITGRPSFGSTGKVAPCTTVSAIVAGRGARSATAVAIVAVPPLPEPELPDPELPEPELPEPELPEPELPEPGPLDPEPEPEPVRPPTTVLPTVPTVLAATSVTAGTMPTAAASGARTARS